jgi:hypothetical protein
VLNYNVMNLKRRVNKLLKSMDKLMGYGDFDAETIQRLDREAYEITKNFCMIKAEINNVAKLITSSGELEYDERVKKFVSGEIDEYTEVDFHRTLQNITGRTI